VETKKDKKPIKQIEIMTFKEKKELLNLIDEYHWNKRDRGAKGDTLYIFIDLWNFEEFSQLFREKHPSLFDDEGIECYWKGSYVCIPDFDDVLDYIGLSEEEMYEMFEKEN
jgi:hypothetical protein